MSLIGPIHKFIVSSDQQLYIISAHANIKYLSEPVYLIIHPSLEFNWVAGFLGMFAMELILFLSNAKTPFPIESIFGVRGFLGLTPANVA